MLAATVVLAARAHAHGNEPHRSGPDLTPVVTDFGRTGDPKQVRRTITVRMHDRMRFVVVNDGRIMHELVLGNEDELRRHAALMRANPEMEHEAPYMAHVAPGKRREIVKFDKPGKFRFGGLVPGHFEAGMVGTARMMPS